MDLFRSDVGVGLFVAVRRPALILFILFPRAEALGYGCFEIFDSFFGFYRAFHSIKWLRAEALISGHNQTLNRVTAP
jgi:hypothetical protein